MKALFLVFLALINFSVLSQDAFFSNQDLGKLSEEYKQKAQQSIDYFRESRLQALHLAPEKGWAILEALPNGGVKALVGVDQNGMPVYYETHNVDAAISIGTNHIWPGGMADFSLDGSSPFMYGKLALWDGGIVMPNHREIAGRVLVEESASSVSDHATHVAATMMGAGLSPLARGMSFGAQQIRSWDFTDDVSEMSVVANTLLVSNHSYGTVAGWRFSSSTTPNWSWHGDINVSSTEDYKFGYYDNRASSYDQMAYYNPYYLIVKSSGNDRNSNGPSVGQPFRRRNASGQWETLNRPSGMSSNNGYNIISTYGNAKNILSVGAVNDVNQGFNSFFDVSISNFSSWGPTDDGRIKPDVVANGVGLYSASSSSANAYRVTSGTSMSAPNASGSIFLLQELYHQLNGHFMLSSTLRGLVCHTADDAGRPGPDYVFGWGLVNTYKAALAISNNGSSSILEEIPLNNEQTITREVIASGSEPLVVSICWTDPEAIPLTVNPSVLNNTTPRLINDLDLRVTYQDDVSLPWVLDPQIPSLNASKGDNVVDNIEQVVINNPIPGKTYTITISHKGSLSRPPQVFSLVATGILNEGFCESTSSSTEGGRINGFVLNTLNNSTSDGCHSYRDFTNLNTTLQAGQTYSFQVVAGTCSDNNPMIAKVFVDWDNNGTFDNNELVATSGILNPGDSFEGSIDVPIDIMVGGASVLRIVMVETENPESVDACGIYARGETQDYLVSLVGIPYDIGPVAITNVFDGACAQDYQNLEVEVRNYGTQTVFGFQITVDLTSGGEPVASFSKTFSDSMNPGKSKVFPISGQFELINNQEYDFTINTILEGDENASNDQLELSIVANQPDNDPRGAFCSGETVVTLYEPNNDNMFWYSDGDGQNLLGAGGRLVLNEMPSSGKIFGAPGYLSGKVGPQNKESEPWAEGGGYSDFSSGRTHFTTYVPLSIKSAKIYSTGTGEMVVQVANRQTDEIIGMKRISLYNTSEGDEDPGQVFPIGIDIPEPGNYQFSYFISGTMVWRSRDHTSNPYPYTIPGVVDILETNQSSPTNFYYYLYDMEVSAIGCKGGDLVEVDIQQRPKPVVDLEGTQQFIDGQLVLNAGNPDAFFLWNTGETTQTIEPQEPGTYSVVVTNQWGCATSDQLNVAVTPVYELEDFPVKVFPNPNTGIFTVQAPGVFNVEIFDTSGRRVFSASNREYATQIELTSLKSGVYILRLNDALSGKVSTHKVVVRR